MMIMISRNTRINMMFSIIPVYFDCMSIMHSMIPTINIVVNL